MSMFQTDLRDVYLVYHILSYSSETELHEATAAFHAVHSTDQESWQNTQVSYE